MRAHRDQYRYRQPESAGRKPVTVEDVVAARSLMLMGRHDEAMSLIAEGPHKPIATADDLNLQRRILLLMADIKMATGKPDIALGLCRAGLALGGYKDLDSEADRSLYDASFTITLNEALRHLGQFGGADAMVLTTRSEQYADLTKSSARFSALSAAALAVIGRSESGQRVLGRRSYKLHIARTSIRSFLEDRDAAQLRPLAPLDAAIPRLANPDRIAGVFDRAPTVAPASYVFLPHSGYNTESTPPPSQSE